MTERQARSAEDVIRIHTSTRSALIRPRLLLYLSIAVLAFLPINNYFRGSTKDYAKWFEVGQAVLAGGDIYAPRGDGTFQFMYPPPAAVLFAIPSYFGELPLIVVLVVFYLTAWALSLRFSFVLAAGALPHDKLAFYLLPGVFCLPYVIENFLLGQPNLLLLALMLGAFVCLQRRKEWTAGALIALAAAIKAFPVLALGHLLYRRQWRASASLLVFLALLLVILPAPFRGVGRNLDDLQTWASGMFRYEEKSISQREQRGFSWSNHSLIAVAHRLLRPVNAHRERDQKLFVNVADMDFKYVTLLIVIIATALGLFYIYCMPPDAQRTTSSDALEYAMLLLLILMITPLAFTYFFVWLLYPLIVVMTLIVAAPQHAVERRRRWVWFWACIALMALTLPIPAFRPVQAAGSTLLACLLLFTGIGLNLRASADRRRDAANNH